jgi:hypothetical protein
MLNSAIIGKDPNGRYWFKSDQCLTDITEATDFYVEKVGVWKWKNWRLVAVYVKRPAYYRDNVNQQGYVKALIENKVLGYYDRHTAASLALEELMRIKDIKEIVT